MKKVTLTILILFCSFHVFSQKNDITTFIRQSNIRSLRFDNDSVPNMDTMYLLSILDSAMRKDPNEKLAREFANNCNHYEQQEFFINTTEQIIRKRKYRKRVDLYLYLAGNYSRVCEYEKCLQTYEEAYNNIDELRNIPIWDQNIAFCYRQLGEYNKAEEAYKNTILYDSTNYFAYCRYADLLNYMNRPDEAIAMLNYANSDSFDRSRYGEYGRVEFIYGYSYYLKEDYRKAINYLKEQVNKDGDNWMSLYFIAKSYDKLGDTGNACAYFQLAVKYEKQDKFSASRQTKFDECHFGKLLLGYAADANQYIETINCP